MNHKVIAGNNGSVHYWTAGDAGSWLVFTHGATMDHKLFSRQVEHFAQEHRVIVWDVPLHGSSRPYEGFSLEAAAVELVNILDQEGVDRAHLVGQSMGGYISQIVALSCPERVMSVTAVDSSPIQGQYYTRIDKLLLSITPALLKLYPYTSLVRAIAKEVTATPHAEEHALGALGNLTKVEIATIMDRVYKGLVRYEHAPSLSCPVLIVYGAMDKTGKVQSYCNRWAEREARELRIIPDAAHNSNLDNPHEFNHILHEFVSKVESKGDVEEMAQAAYETAIFAGGCFWCMVSPFDVLDGVIEIKSGYIGGTTDNPTYEEVKTQTTGHYEAVKITYDPSLLTYAVLLRAFWMQIDPTDDGGQFHDRGSAYRTAIFYTTEEQRIKAEASKEAIEESARFESPIVTQIVPAGEFYVAEDYHQDFYSKKPDVYKEDRGKSGRDEFIKRHWGDEYWDFFK